MDAAELINDALKQTKDREADVRKAALLRIARVLTITCPTKARATLEDGLVMYHGLQTPFSVTGFEQLSRFSIAAVCPQRFAEIPLIDGNALYDAFPSGVVRVMREHGHLEYLRQYLLRDAPVTQIPIREAGDLMASAGDDEERRTLMRRVIECWRIKFKHSVNRYFRDREISVLLHQYWTILPRDEALAIVNEIIENAVGQPALSRSFEETGLLKPQQAAIFENFHILRELDPVRAEEYRKTSSEVASALEKYPDGLQSVPTPKTEPEVQAIPGPRQSGYLFRSFGTPAKADLDYMRQLGEIEKTGDFQKLLELALAKYQSDIDEKNRNTASKAFWPSAAMYRSIFYWIGFYHKRWQLELVPDQDLRLFAQIELAGGLCGLPELMSMVQRTSNSQPDGWSFG